MLAQSPSIVPLTASHEPIFNGVIIPYHVTPAPRLLSVKFDKLESVGFSRSSFGDHNGATLGKLPGPSTALALLQFTSFTKSLLPSRAGGSDEDAPFTPSKATSSILSAVSAGRSAFGQKIEAESAADLLAGLRAVSAGIEATSPVRIRRAMGLTSESFPPRGAGSTSSPQRVVEEAPSEDAEASSTTRTPDEAQLYRILESLSPSLHDLSSRSKTSPELCLGASVSPCTVTPPTLPSASDEQGHLVAALQCTLLRSSAQAYLSEVAAAYPELK